MVGKLSRSLSLYVAAVASVGTIAIAFSIWEVLGSAHTFRNQWLALVGLTLASGLLPARLRTADVSVSVSETFVIAGTLLFGRSGGTTLALLDQVVMVISLWRRLRPEQVPFNLTASPLSLWLACTLIEIPPLFQTSTPLSTAFLLRLMALSGLYFIFSSGLLTIAIALQKGVPAPKLWWEHFRDLLMTYAAAGSIAALLVYNTRQVRPEFVVAILPLLVVMFLTSKWSNQRIEAERERNVELNRVFLSTVEALALAIDAKDQVTHGHIRRVQAYTLALAQALGIKDDKELDAIRAAALLHDTGKLAVPEYILNKPGPLTASEFERMKVHADVGADILKSIEFPYPVEPIVRHHHEAWDGSGYPAGLKGQEIPVGARILSVVDCYDALTSDRPYRPRMTRDQAAQILRERRGSAYDPWVVDEFIRLLDELEVSDAESAGQLDRGQQSILPPAQFEAITATTAEEREFSELRRELLRTPDVPTAAEVVFKHLRRLLPVASMALYERRDGTNVLSVTACSGVASTTLLDSEVAVGERISGWVFANSQSVINSDAALELGPVAKTLTPPLRYVTAAPFGQGQISGVLLAFATSPFERDHLRLLENTASLFGMSLSEATSSRPAGVPPHARRREDVPSIH